jgi:transcriptional regulator with XRE-family HTH domain
MASIPIFGRRVTRIREERGLTQQELAKKAGTSYQTIWRIEAGKHVEPGIYIARRIARALGVSLDFLVDLHGEGKDGEMMPTELASAGRES